MNILVIRELVNRVKKLFGDNVYLELFVDGSGYIRSYDESNLKKPHLLVGEFDGLGELAEILGE